MDRRNWLHLGRKLVDVTDLDYSVNAVQLYMAQNNLAFFGEGVLVTTTYPNPFPIALSPTALSGTVGKGIAYDPTGLQTRIDNTNGSFVLTNGDVNLGRLDLLVLRYVALGDTQIPEPDLPTSNTYLNLVDGYQLAVIAGTPSGSPSYPAKGQYDIILCGFSVPANATLGTQIAIDLTVREIATPSRAFLPTFKQETAAGAIDGVNQSFTLSMAPYNQASVLVSVDGVALTSTEWSLSGSTLTLNTAPEVGQDVYAFYVVNSAGSVNPVSGIQETPVGVVDGTNATFSLSGEPVDQNSTQIFVDGLVVPSNGWSLVQSPTSSQIIFANGFVPEIGSQVYAFYFRNAVAVSQGSSGGSSGGGSGSSANLIAEYPQLQASDISNGYVTLTHLPAAAAAVLLDVLGGGPQAYGTDFTVSGMQLTWAGDLVSSLAIGDRLRIYYAY